MPHKEIVFKDHLIQSTLSDCLHKIVGNEDWIGEEVRVPETRYRWDMMFKIKNDIFVVEFDGDGHYRDSLLIRNDIEKDKIAYSLGYITVRIPYFVQLTNETLWHFFRLKADIKQDFPHGFIKSKIFPASFCRLGLMRFEKEMSSLPKNINTCITESLKNAAKIYGEQYVFDTISLNIN